MASPTMQKVAKAARDYLKPDKFGGTRVVESHALTYATNGTVWDDVAENTAHGPSEKYKLPAGAKFVPPPPIEDQPASPKAGPEAPATLPRDFFDRPRAMLVSVNLDGIKQVAVDETGMVFSIETSKEAWVSQTEAPAMKAFVVPLLYPILGLMLPWGGIRILTWVGSGFVEPRR